MPRPVALLSCLRLSCCWNRAWSIPLLMGVVVLGAWSDAAAAEVEILRGGQRIRVAVPEQVRAVGADPAAELDLGQGAWLTRRILVRPAPGQDVVALGRALGLTDGGPVAGGEVRVLSATTPTAAAAAAVSLQAQGVRWAEPELRTTPVLQAVPNDPLFAERQWNLAADHLGAAAAWDHTRGGGVTVAVVDTGVESAHPDLAGRVAVELGFARDGGSSEPIPTEDTAYHGTFCASQIAANQNDGIGMSGIAPEARIIPVRFLSGAVSDSQWAACLAQGIELGGSLTGAAVTNNSWGLSFSSTINSAFLIPSIIRDVVVANATQGRAGRGVLQVWASGNDANRSDTADWDPYPAQPEALTVGANRRDGTRSAYSELGTCVFLSAPVSPGVTGADLSGAAGDSAGDYLPEVTGQGEGTSFAAPQVVGVAALCLAVRPELSWRDLRRVLARSARQVDPGATAWPWLTNQAGLHWNHEHGFGEVDAAAAVALAQTIDLLPPAGSGSVSVALSGASATIPDGVAIDGPARVVTAAFLAASHGIDRVERVRLTCAFTSGVRCDLAVTVQSPAGTRIVIPRRVRDTGSATTVDWTFSLVGFLGEEAEGIWTVEVRDRFLGDSSTLGRIDLTIDGYLHGSEAETLTTPVHGGGTVDAESRPTQPTFSRSLTPSEADPIGTVVGTASATAIGTGTSYRSDGRVTYALLPGTGTSDRFVIDPATGVVTVGASLAGAVGDHRIRVVAMNSEDGGGESLVRAFTFPVESGIPTVALSLLRGQVGQAYEVTPTFRHRPTGFAATGLPAGLEIDPLTGRISGTPAVAGSFPVTVTASNDFGSGNASGTLVIDAIPAPVITSFGAANGTLSRSFVYTITASGDPTSFGASGLPAGLGVDPASGLISGRPAEAGTFNATMSATSIAGTGTADLTIRIEDPATSTHLFITSPTEASGTVSVPFLYQTTVNQENSLSYSITGLPAGLTADSSGEISGIPTAAGTSTVALQVFSDFDSDAIDLVITIAPDASEPVPMITSALTATGTVGQAFDYLVEASGSPTDFGATGLPAGLSFSAVDHRISGTPTASGSRTVVLTASNAAGSGTAALVITIAPAATTTPATAGDAGGGGCGSGGALALLLAGSVLLRSRRRSCSVG